MRIAIAFLGVVAFLCGATQEIRVLDLTGIAQSVRPDINGIRVPDGVEREPLICPQTEYSPAKIRTSLEWLETKEIRIKQIVGMTVKIENVGKSPVDVPIASQVEDVQPTTPATPVEYYSLTVPLTAGLPSGGTTLGWLFLYGSTSKPDTLMTLKPGQALRIRGKVFISRSYATDQSVTVSSSFKLAHNLKTGDVWIRARPKWKCINEVVGATLPATVKAP